MYHFGTNVDRMFHIKKYSSFCLYIKKELLTLHLKVLLIIRMNTQIDDIRAIREMMEKSSKFLSLSGLSGVIAGFVAIAGAAFAYFYLSGDALFAGLNSVPREWVLLADAVIVLFISISFGLFFSWRKARKSKQGILTKLVLRTFYNLAVPLAAGGIFCFILLLKGELGMVMAGTLLFYGLALLNVSKYTYDEIHYLGLIEIGLGLVAAIFQEYGLLFWTIGFGVCHILYGFVMYRKYDLKKG